MTTTHETPSRNGTALAVAGNRVVANHDDLLPSQRMMEFCQAIAQSNLVPKDFRGRAADIMIAVQMGMEVGLKPMQALHSIAVINGRPALYGDGALAVVRARPDCEDVVELISGDGDARTATCSVKRAGSTKVDRSFSVMEAKKAALWSKDGPWKQYPDRMLQMRARGFALRDSFPDALKGFAIVEDIMDIPAGDPGQPTPREGTRTEQVMAKVVGAARVEAAAPGAEPPGAATEPQDALPAAAAEGEEKVSARELRNAIGRAWKNVSADVKNAILNREYAKTSLLDLSIGQLEDFLERTPELIPAPAAATPE
jgi:hypothetical protein